MYFQSGWYHKTECSGISKNCIFLLISWGLFLKVTYAAWCLICATMSISIANIAKLNSEEDVLTKMTGREKQN